MTKNFDAAMPYLLDRGIAIISAVLILIFGLWFSRVAKRWTIAALRRAPNLDSTLEGFFGSIVAYFIIIVTLLAVLAKFGIQTTSLIAVLGAAGLAIGLALQGTLSNVAAGVMLFIFRPFRGGDYVEVAGVGGTVRTLTLFTTELATPENVQIIIPNSKVWGDSIRNYSHHSSRRFDVIFRTGYNADISQAMGEIRKLADTEARIQKNPAPVIALSALGDVSMDILLRGWAKRQDIEAVKFAMLEAVQKRFIELDISIKK